MKIYWVYIITNSLNTVLYTGMTNNLERRMYEHMHKLVVGFSARYNLNKLIYYQEFNSALEAIAAEKKIKGWKRNRKVELIESQNLYWKDLSENFYNEDPS